MQQRFLDKRNLQSFSSITIYCFIGLVKLNSLLIGIKGFFITFEFEEGITLYDESTTLSNANISASYFITGVKLKSLLKGGECLFIPLKMSKGISLIGVYTSGMRIKTNFMIISIKSFFITFEFSKREPFVVVAKSIVGIKLKNLFTGQKGYIVTFCLVISTEV
jgi:hypothetical protein